MKGRGELVLYLDFDGVLHHENCLWHPRRGAYLCAPAEHSLFQHAEQLTGELERYPRVFIVLSTSWVLRYGFTRCAKRLPDALQRRCIGATFHSRHMQVESFLDIPRGIQVLEDVSRRKPKSWVALDDNDQGWPAAAPWIQTDPVQGLAGVGVIANLRTALAAMHGQ